MKIEIVSKQNYNQFLGLMTKYQIFYQATPDEKKNKVFFEQFLEDHSRGIIFIIKEDEKPIGFTTLYFTFSSVTACPLCILNDLYVDPEYNSYKGIRSIGNKLMLHSFNYAKSLGYYKISGTTDHDNHQAQILYDSLVKRYNQFNVKKSSLIEYCAYFESQKSDS